MEEFLRGLGISGDFQISDDGCLNLEIANSDEFGKIYSKLEKSQEVEEDEDVSQITLFSSEFQFTSDKYTITLLCDLEADTYKLACREN